MPLASLERRRRKDHDATFPKHFKKAIDVVWIRPAVSEYLSGRDDALIFETDPDRDPEGRRLVDGLESIWVHLGDFVHSARGEPELRRFGNLRFKGLESRHESCFFGRHAAILGTGVLIFIGAIWA